VTSPGRIAPRLPSSTPTRKLVRSHDALTLAICSRLACAECAGVRCWHTPIRHAATGRPEW
jgi:hypothetical protein